jgi:AGZA family xanthine/uracil permease-like MFS transporter
MSSHESSLSARVDRFFHLTDNNTTIGTEIRAGATTFLTMAYILFVNPQILAQAGMPQDDVLLATAIASALATLMMGLYARYPFALAPGMGLNAYFTFGVVQGLGVSYQVALAAVFLEGLLFLALTVAGVRTAIINAIPRSLKVATTSGIGLFLAIIGLVNGEVVVSHPETLVSLGDVHDPTVLLTLAGLVIMGALMANRTPGALLIGIVAVAGVAWVTGLEPAPSAFLSVPSLPGETFMAFDFDALVTGPFLTVVLAFLFVDFFDTAGTLVGIGRLGGFLDDDGKLPRADRAFASDAAGTTIGAMLGTSTVTSYIESATGIEEGGRTGLTATVVAVLLLGAMFFTPVITAVPAAATAPALVVVGALMMKGARDIPWDHRDEAIPAFLAMVTMPLTYSIANGIALGIVSYVLLKVLTGKAGQVHALMYVLAFLLVLYFGIVGTV